MKSNNEVGNRVELEIGLADVVGEEIEIEARVKVKARLPQQDEKLPDTLEAIAEEAGQEFKCKFFRQGIELADLQLVMSRRAGKENKGIDRIGKKDYTFKTIFGTVKVARIRIRHKADGSTQILSAHVWKTPKQAMITRGLRSAVCNFVVKESFSSTVAQIEKRSG